MLNLIEVYEQLPLTERTLLKRIRRNEYPFQLLNDYGQPCEYRVVENGVELGMVKYYGGRKLACYELTKPASRDRDDLPAQPWRCMA
jgi:hypothetical protein